MIVHGTTPPRPNPAPAYLLVDAPARELRFIYRSTADAKAVCRNCPVRVECLDYAMTMREKFGIWGGLSERERRRLRRQRSGLRVVAA